MVFFFFFQAEDGIRDGRVTGVQTCALPISLPGLPRAYIRPRQARPRRTPQADDLAPMLGGDGPVERSVEGEDHGQRAIKPGDDNDGPIPDSHNSLDEA